MIVTETSGILTTVQLQKSKLLSMKSHLNDLLRKKLRIETEIVLLRKQIKGKLKISETKIKASINLESSEELTNEQAELLRREHPDLFQELIDFDSLAREIEEFTTYFESNV